MQGFIFIDKPKGVSTFFVVRVLRRVTHERRIGYVGTLDPLATGLVIAALGEARKCIFYLENMSKTYEVTIKFGAVSETYDSEGPIHEYPNAQPADYNTVEKALHEHFSGEREQKPPLYSAIQIGGKRAYAMVRKGQPVELKHRKVTFYNIEIVDYDYPRLRCRIRCSSGTYIRSFAHDLGQILGCGGYVEELRRTAIGDYSVNDAVHLDKLDEDNLKDYFKEPQIFLKNWRQLELTPEEYRVMSNGSYVLNRGAFEAPPVLALFEGKAVGVLEPVNNGKLLKFARKFNLSP